MKKNKGHPSVEVTRARNPNPPRQSRKVAERGYFHTGNSGISISMIEEIENYDWDEQDRNYYNHFLEVRHSAFGAGTTLRTPIAGPVMCDYYIEAFTRLRDRMLRDPLYRVPNPFDRYNHPNLPLGLFQSKSNDNHRIVDIADGLLRQEVWSEEIITSESSTEKRLLGHNYIDPDTDMHIRFVPFRGDVSVGSGGSHPIYDRSMIGKPVSAVHEQNVDEEVETILEQIADQTKQHPAYGSNTVLTKRQSGQVVEATKYVGQQNTDAKLEWCTSQILDWEAAQTAVQWLIDNAPGCHLECESLVGNGYKVIATVKPTIKQQFEKLF